MELRHYFNIIFKWWWLIVIAAVIAGAAAFLGSLTTPRQYQSRATLMVGQVLQNPNPDVSGFSTAQALAQNYSELVRREPVLRGTLDALGLPQPPWDWAILQGMVSSRVVPGTQLFEIAVLDNQPQRAKDLAQELINQLKLQSPAGTDTQTDTERQFMTTQAEDLRTNITKAQDEIRQLDNVIASATSARQIQDARTRQDSLRSQVSSWQATYVGLQTALQQGTTNFISVVEQPQVPSAPVGTSTSTTVLIAAAIGATLAVGAAFLLEYLDDTVKSADDVRQLTQLATLGGVPNISGEQLSDKLIALRQPRSPVTEDYRMIRTNMRFSTIDNPLRTMIVTSPNPGDGKSLTTANLAVVLAQSGQRVIVVDADLRRPMLHRIFELDDKVGLTTILPDPAIHVSDVWQNTPIENLKVITAGPIPPNPADMLGSKRMGQLIEELRTKAEIVIFDTPPVTAVADASILSVRVDGVLLVVRSGRTRRSPMQHSKDILATAGANLLGVVMNQVPTRGKSYQYYYAQDEPGESRGLLGNVRNRRKRQPRTSAPQEQAAMSQTKVQHEQQSSR
ncbi:MAG TPA: polysaccharide biosynthesis tyrosine autokinase [Anaerolineae bacterium]|nr:polysaccharide biosynthesis tyrosine autokinase [Anaerolineae bacterium]